MFIYYRTIPFSCYKYALLTLHSLVSDKVHGPQCAQQARQMDTMQVVSGWLQHEKSEKLLPVIVDLVRILCDKNYEQKVNRLRLSKFNDICRHSRDVRVGFMI
ncbi:unnamed protein product [Haemonchus placei]|uniref:Uncharacterized protein n=1 Tax=Haemonchus placei TaxID=6290 RepID=A0A3P8BCJ2_HAEPC|nr:unnamed protein product [Haemonchus placei]